MYFYVVIQRLPCRAQLLLSSHHLRVGAFLFPEQIVAEAFKFTAIVPQLNNTVCIV
jgi:hypothetical protein